MVEGHRPFEPYTITKENPINVEGRTNFGIQMQ